MQHGTTCIVSSVVVPSPIVFDLSPKENHEIRTAYSKANGGRLILPLVATNGLLHITMALFLAYRHNPLGWVWFSVGLLYFALIVALLRGRIWYAWTRPQLATEITFLKTGIEIERGATLGTRVKKHVPFAQIRSVQMTPEALFISKTWSSIIFIPKRALGDQSERVIAFFQEYLVAKTSLQRSSSMATTIVNTKS